MIRNIRIFSTLIIISLIIFLSFFIKNFRIDASSDSLVAQNDKDFQFYNYYQKIFPTKNTLIIAIESNKQIDKKVLKNIEKISKEIVRLPEVETVFNINKAPILFLNEISLIELSNNNFETILNSNYEINNILEEFSNSPIYSNQIINSKKNITSLLILLKKNQKIEDLKKNKTLYIDNDTYYIKKTEIDNDRNILINNIREILKTNKKEYNYYLGGVEMISSDVISFVKSDIIFFSFLVLLLVLIILFIIFRKLKWVFVIITSSLISVYLAIGIISFFNIEITAVSANFIPLMFILSISMKIHIVNNYLLIENNIEKTINSMFWPCFYTFLTTVVAFLSLVISDIKPIIDFGIIMIISLIVIILTAFTILPLLISFFSIDNNKNPMNLAIINNFFYYAQHYTKYVIIINILMFIISIIGIFNLNVENSFIKYFKSNTEIYKGMKLIDSELGGTTPIDIVLKFKNEKVNNNSNNQIIDEEETEFEDDIFTDDLFSNNENIWFTEDKILTIKKIHKFLENRKEIGKVNSIYTLINIANMINKNDLSTFELSVLYSEIPNNYKSDLIFPYLNIEEDMVKISARVRDSEDIKRADLIEDINGYISNNFQNLEYFKINGLLVLYNNMLSSLFSTQIKSLGFVLLSIFIMFIILFKSIKLSIVGIIPNIFASTFILGLIGLLKIPLDIMTITIAAITIGIAVDNTIHYLYRYKKNTLNEENYLNAIQTSHLTVGKAVLTTSIAISLGFLVLCISNFVPTIIFGLFTSLAMIFAMIGVLLTLPSILKYLR